MNRFMGFALCAALAARADVARSQDTPAQAPSADAAAVQPLFEQVSSEQSGVTVRHPFLPNHRQAYLYTSGFACGGVCIGDVDGDGRPDLFFTCGPEPHRLYLQTDEPLAFRDGTAEAGLPLSGARRPKPWSAGAALADLDRDGDLDIYVCNYDAPNELFVNDGHGKFVEQARAWGLDIVDASLFPAFMDVDGSGELALYLVTNRYERPGGRPPQPPVRVVEGRPRVLPEFAKYYVLKQSAPGKFQMDFAGRPDRFFTVTRDAQDSPRYRDVTFAAGLRPAGAHGLSATWFDYDDDGRPDLYVANDYTDPDCLYRNEGPAPDGTPRFKNVIADVAPITSWSSMGADAADVNNDGRLDLLVGEMAATSHRTEMITGGQGTDRLETLLHSLPRQTTRNTLLLNSGAGRFLEVAYQAGVARTDWTWAVKLADFDNDGQSDLFVTTGSTRNFTDADLPFRTENYVGHTDWDLLRDQPPRREANLAFRNVDGLRFENVSAAWGLDHVGMSYGAAYGDLDADGDLDLVVCNLDEEVAIYRNRGVPGRHWLAVKLVGSASHAQGWGAAVRVKTAAGWQVRQLSPGTGFLSHNDPVLHFGLGEDAAIEAVEVRWPSGRRQRVEGVAADQVLRIAEPEADAAGDAGPGAEKSSDAPPLFARAEDLGLNVRHRERPFDDYAREPLLPGKRSQLGPGVAVADANGDGRDDVYVGGAAGQAGALLVRGDAGFAPAPGPWEADAACEDMGAVWFDANGDGRLDLYVVSGGVESAAGGAEYQDRLYVNAATALGEVRFARAPDDALPDEAHAGSAACAADFDRDGDLDLFVGGRTIPGRYPQAAASLLLRNESTPQRVRFVEASADAAPELAAAGIVSGAVWSDVDADGWPDLLLACEWGPVRVIRNDHGRLAEQTAAAGLADRTGWWNGIASGDFDADGRVDYLVTNVGLNTKYGEPDSERPTVLFAGDLGGSRGQQLVEAKVGAEGLLPVRGLPAAMQAVPELQYKFPTHRSYAAATLEQIYDAAVLAKCQRLEANEFRSGVLLNRSAEGQIAFEWRPLPDVAQIAPGYGAAVGDFNGDGRCDAVLAQNLLTREPDTGLWRGGLGQLLLGTDEGRFAAVDARASGVVIAGDAKGAATMDVDGDARPDLLVTQNDDATVALRNQGSGTWLALRILNEQGAPAIGARATVRFADGRLLAAEAMAGSGYLSQSAPDVFLGVGENPPASVEVRWPDGGTRTVELKGQSGRVVIAPEATGEPR